jgi:hypothetical protein
MMAMSKTTLIASETPKGREILRNVAIALDKLGLDENALQCIVHRAGELQKEAGKLMKNLAISNQFANEEVRSNYAYPPEYKGPKPIEDQIKAIAKIFDLDPESVLEFSKNLPVLTSFVPSDALQWTGYFAIPSVDALAKKYFPEVIDTAEKYCRAVQLIHAKIAKSRKFYNYREGQITPDQLRNHIRTAEAMAKIAEIQKGEIIIVAAQLGMLHRGKSVRRAREVFFANEFGLGSLAVGSIILTHPERLVRWEEQDMDCAGDEFAPDADGDFCGAPYFSFFDGEVEFDSCRLDNAHEGFGSASGFLPECPEV